MSRDSYSYGDGGIQAVPSSSSSSSTIKAAPAAVAVVEIPGMASYTADGLAPNASLRRKKSIRERLANAIYKRRDAPAAINPHDSSSPVPSSVVSTRTRDQLRAAEEERDRLKSLASRLKKEGEFGPTAAEAENRLLRLELEALRGKTAVATRSSRPEPGLFKQACSTDLVFLIDTTSSMGMYIGTAIEKVRSIIDSLDRTWLREAVVRVAIVGYKDHNDSPNIQHLDFTTNVDLARNFLASLQATGGADTPEDVLGGLSQVLKLDWKQSTRQLIHIADAPPHGTDLHDLGSLGDSYSRPGSEPHGLTYVPLVKQMISMNINYLLLQIHDITDKMAYCFFEEYANVSTNCALRDTNKYSSRSRELLSRLHPSAGLSFQATEIGGLQFEEQELGSNYSSMESLIVKSVTTSATRTASRMSSSSGAGRYGSKPGRSGRLSKQLTAIREDPAPISVTLEAGPPQWNRAGWLDVTVKVEAYFPDVGMHGTSSLLDPMMESDKNIKITTTDLTIHRRSKPFGQGAMRIACYARTDASTSDLVVKSSKIAGHGKGLADLTEDMRCQALCKAFALEFNALSEARHSIDFVTTACLMPKGTRKPSDNCMALEPYISGEYVKYNSNGGWVNDAKVNDPFHHAAQAFSHFTFERSRGRFLVSDLQGVGHVLTDPAVHTRDLDRFPRTPTNLGEDGFKFFFATHACNDVCRKLGLRSRRDMLAPGGRLQFRTSWPPLSASSRTMRVCCSNKLCSRIVLLSEAKKSADFVGYHWCDGCWPQLGRSEVSLLCVAPGTRDVPHHEFVVSKFFYESQGTIVPRQCPEHRPVPDSVSRSTR